MSDYFKLPCVLSRPYSAGDATPFTPTNPPRSILGRLCRVRPRNPWRGRRQRGLLECRIPDYADAASRLQEAAALEDPGVSCILAFNELLAAHVRGDKDAVSRMGKKIEIAFGFVVNATRPWKTV
jgi:hypothetical protein